GGREFAPSSPPSSHQRRRRPVEAARRDRAPQYLLKEIGAMDEFIILSQQDLRAAMRFGDYVEAVADGFRLLAEGRCASPVPTQIDVAHGAFHLKPASLPRGPGYVAVKVNGNFPDNRARHGLPTIQGAVLLA